MLLNGNNCRFGHPLLRQSGPSASTWTIRKQNKLIAKHKLGMWHLGRNRCWTGRVRIFFSENLAHVPGCWIISSKMKKSHVRVVHILSCTHFFVCLRLLVFITVSQAKRQGNNSNSQFPIQRIQTQNLWRTCSSGVCCRTINCQSLNFVFHKF